MSATADYLQDPELLRAEWDLSPLVDDQGDAGVDRELSEARERASAFAERHAGKVAELDGEGLREAMMELAAISELVGKAGSYASLKFSTDTADPVRGALLQKVTEAGTEIETKLLFFELEWAAVEDERAEELLSSERARLRPAPSAERSALPPASALRARGEDPGREVDLQPGLMEPAVR